MKTKTLIRLLLLVIVSAAFILARFGTASADSFDTQSNTVSKQAAEEDKASPSGNSVSAFTTGNGGNSMFLPLIKLFGALIVVVAAIYGFLLLLRKMMGSKFSGNRSNRLIEVLETSHVGQKKSVSLIRYHDRSVLVGMADNSISVLAELDSVETGKIMSEVNSEKPSGGFDNIFHNARRKISNIGMNKIKAALVSGKPGKAEAA